MRLSRKKGKRKKGGREKGLRSTLRRHRIGDWCCQEWRHGDDKKE